MCAAQNMPVGATLKEFSPGQLEVNLHHVANAELACDHAVLFKRAVKAVAQAARHGGELHGEAVRGLGGLQPARAREPRSTRPAATCSPDRAVGSPSRTRCVTPSAGLRRRWRSRWRSSRRRRIRIGATGPACSCRSSRTGESTTAASSLRIPLSAPEDARVEHRPGGSDGNPYLVMAAILAGIHHGITNRCDPGPMVSPGEVIEEKITLPRALGCGARCVRSRESPAAVSGQALSRALFGTCRREECERSTRRSRIATTSGTCARSDWIRIR